MRIHYNQGMTATTAKDPPPVTETAAFHWGDLWPTYLGLLYNVINIQVVVIISTDKSSPYPIIRSSSILFPVILFRNCSKDQSPNIICIANNVISAVFILLLLAGFV